MNLRNRNVRRSLGLLECSGYQCLRLFRSDGWSLIGIAGADVLLVKVTGENWPAPEERETLQAFPCPPNCRKLVHRWRKGARLPDVLILR
ncbi:MAG TPA: hypothetical protein VKV79_06840 [Terriglobia bacterium]|nr:hypothetical protein [Terriglobia bacterium]